jgi:glycosyltransferase involved in cell wall biosynthesis
MRIVLIHHSAPPVVGGVERVVGHHARLLAAAGHEVVVVAGRGSLGGRRVTFVHEPLADSLHPEVLVMSAALAAGEVPPLFAVIRDRLIESLGTAIATADVVIAHNVASLNKNLALTAALHTLATRTGGPRLVLWHHDLAWALPHYRPSLHDGDPWDLLRTAWPGVTQVAISEARRIELAAITGLPPASITVVPNGIDVHEMLSLDHRTIALTRSLPVLDADPLLLMPARIIPRKNIELGIRVVAVMRDLGRPAGLLVTGPVDPHDGEESAYLDRLRALANEVGAVSHVWCPGAASERGLTDAVVADLYSLADVLFLPSREEGFGIPVLEALLHRLPIVCADLSVLREVAGDAATYVDPDGDPGAVAGAILERLESDPVSRGARRVRRESSWEAIHERSIAPLLASLVRVTVPVP